MSVTQEEVALLYCRHHSFQHPALLVCSAGWLFAGTVLALFAAQPTVAESKADAWDEGLEAASTWTPVSPSGIPHDPPRNPYRQEADHG